MTLEIMHLLSKLKVEPMTQPNLKLSLFMKSLEADVCWAKISNLSLRPGSRPFIKSDPGIMMINSIKIITLEFSIK